MFRKHESPPVQTSNDAAKSDPHRNSESQPTPDTLTLALDVRLKLLGVSIIGAVAVLVGLTLVLQHGVQLGTYDSRTMSPTQRNELLNTYNGYSGNAAAALGRPLALLVAMVAQLFVLRFCTKSLLQPEPKRHVAVVAVAVSVVLGFFLNNGFNALNVQLRDHAIRPKINASDLAFQSNSSLSLASATKTSTSTVTRTLSEGQPRNPVTNTILRSVVAPRVPKAPPQCRVTFTGMRFPDDLVDYGFPQREWMQYLLPEALNTTRLRFVLNATEPTATRNVPSGDLPMNATRAADLFLTAVLTSHIYIPYGLMLEYNSTEPRTRGALRANQTVPAAITSGLLPLDPTASEAEQRTQLLQRLPSFFSTQGVQAFNVSRSNIGIEFTHVELSPSLAMDAMTWEIDLDPEILTTQYGQENSTRLYHSKLNCGPWPAVCAFSRLENDVPVVVHAYAACVNSDGSETLLSLPDAVNAHDYAIDCPQQSNSSIILLTATKRLVADALRQNATVDPAGFDKSLYAVTTNLRKIYSFTVSRLDWHAEDVAVKYNAECLSTDCSGLDVGLSSGERLLVGTAALPLAQLTPIDYRVNSNSGDLHPYPLIRLIEPPPTHRNAGPWGVIAGDLLLPHNVKTVEWDVAPRQLSPVETNECEVAREDRQQLVLNNHLYIESPLQTTYTAALFFLFQNGVGHEKIIARDQIGETLAFDGNLLVLSLWMSIPTHNAVLTCIGCVFLVIGFVSMIMWSSNDASDYGDSRQAITTPHVIARAMLDTSAFPPSVVRRRIVTTTTGHRLNKSNADVDGFVIESLVLKPRDDSEAVGGRA